MKRPDCHEILFRVLSTSIILLLTINRLESLGNTSISYEPGRINFTVKFWEDIWYQHCSLVTRFYHLYQLCTNKEALLVEVITSQGTIVQFRRIFLGTDQAEWAQILSIVNSIHISDSLDTLLWRWKVSEKFSTHSIYRLLNKKGVLASHPLIWWTLLVPPKIRIFIWLTMYKKILTKDTLTRKGWVGNNQCHFCIDHETRDHLFLTYPLAHQIWFYLGKSQHFLPYWFTWEDIFQHALNLPKFECICLLVVLSVVCWTLWKHRNKVCFNDIQPKYVRTLIFLIKSLLDYWAWKMKQQAREAA